MHPALKTALGIAGIYLVYCGLVFIFQRQMLFPRYMAMSLSKIPEQFPGLERI